MTPWEEGSDLTDDIRHVSRSFLDRMTLQMIQPHPWLSLSCISRP